MTITLDRPSQAKKPNHLFNYLRYKATPHFMIPPSPARTSIDGVRFDCFPERDRNYRRMYFGVYEPEILALLRQFLRPGDTFIDVGANVGYLSAVAASLVGKQGAVHSFEPTPQYFQAAESMAQINPDYSITVNQQALGSEQSRAEICITNLDNMGWNTLVPNFMSEETVRETVEVPVGRLDDYLSEQQVDNVTLIKIDVEGFELPVLQGMSQYFEQHTERPPILCEVAPTAYPLLDSSLAELRDLIESYGYKTVDVEDLSQQVDLTQLTTTTNVVFVKA